MTRRSLREYTFFLLFQKDFYPPEELDAQIKTYGKGRFNNFAPCPF